MQTEITRSSINLECWVTQEHFLQLLSRFFSAYKLCHSAPAILQCLSELCSLWSHKYIQQQFVCLRRLRCTLEGCKCSRTEDSCPNNSAFTSLATLLSFLFCLRVRKKLLDKRWSLSFSSSSPAICSRAKQMEWSSSWGQLMLFMLLVQHLPKRALSRLCPHDASTIQTFCNKHFPNHSLRCHCLGLIRMDANKSGCLKKRFYLREDRSAVVSSKERKLVRRQACLWKRQMQVLVW